jgi:hypothetical protein
MRWICWLACHSAKLICRSLAVIYYDRVLPCFCHLLMALKGTFEGCRTMYLYIGCCPRTLRLGINAEHQFSVIQTEFISLEKVRIYDWIRAGKVDVSGFSNKIRIFLFSLRGFTSWDRR